jgi:hypothetical protein
MSKDKMCSGGPCKDADGPSSYDSKHGFGGAGGSPVKFLKREGGLEDGRIKAGFYMQVETTEEPPVHKGPQSNFD